MLEAPIGRPPDRYQYNSPFSFFQYLVFNIPIGYIVSYDVDTTEIKLKILPLFPVFLISGLYLFKGKLARIFGGLFFSVWVCRGLERKIQPTDLKFFVSNFRQLFFVFGIASYQSFSEKYYF